jgi:hypothetical protein
MSEQRITKQQARDYVRRWKLVNQAEIEELRRTPMAMKFRQLQMLMASVDELGWRKELEEGEAEVRERWARLRRKLLG